MVVVVMMIDHVGAQSDYLRYFIAEDVDVGIALEYIQQYCSRCALSCHRSVSVKDTCALLAAAFAVLTQPERVLHSYLADSHRNPAFIGLPENAMSGFL